MIAPMRVTVAPTARVTPPYQPAWYMIWSVGASVATPAAMATPAAAQPPPVLIRRATATRTLPGVLIHNRIPRQLTSARSSVWGTIAGFALALGSAVAPDCGSVGT